jgi:tRNA A-37 threonylcarbamoyl transferase component Bud32
MAFVRINPAYAERLARLGLSAAEEFLALPGVIVSGHPDRHVVKVALGQGKQALSAYLKREHRVRWRDRLANAWAGFGFVARSTREARVLAELERAEIGCPEWIAAGEDDAGRAFVLVRELTGLVDLRVFLDTLTLASPYTRHRFAATLGEALARIHAQGFIQPDLYSKHVFVDPNGEQLAFLDWQRSRQRRSVAWRDRWRDLGALDATLAEDVATRQERLTCLQAYLYAALAGDVPRELLVEAIRRTRVESHRLARKRRIRELRRLPNLEPGAQHLLWLDGEALCVTEEFHRRLRGRMPRWLRASSASGPENRPLVRSTVKVGRGRRGLLLRRRQTQPLRRLWNWLRGRRPTSPELSQASLLFRLQRHGVATPRVLAMGQQLGNGGRVDSFLLIERLARGLSLPRWLLRNRGRRRRLLLRQTAQMLRQIHQSGCHFARCLSLANCGSQGWKKFPLWVQRTGAGIVNVALASVESVQLAGRGEPGLQLRDLIGLCESAKMLSLSATDCLRFFLAYRNERKLSSQGKQIALQIIRRCSRKQSQPRGAGFQARPDGQGRRSHESARGPTASQGRGRS